MEPFVITVTLNPALDKTVLIDKFDVGGLNRVKSSRTDPGGKGVNVAKVLNNLKVNVKATGLIAGIQGNLLLDYLNNSGIDSDFHKIAGETRTNLKIVEETSNITTEVNEPGFTVLGNDLEAFKVKLLEQMSKASFLVLSGSLPPGVNEDIYYELIMIAKSKGVKTILDADGQALINGIKASPYAIKPNIHELQNLTGRKLKTTKEIVQSARSLLAEGIEVIVVSMGAEGALLINKTHCYKAKTFEITPKSTVAAGDSMVATFVYAMLNNYHTKELLQLITSAGTVTASKAGTEVCTLDEVINSQKKVQIEELNF